MPSKPATYARARLDVDKDIPTTARRLQSVPGPGPVLHTATPLKQATHSNFATYPEDDAHIAAAPIRADRESESETDFEEDAHRRKHITDPEERRRRLEADPWCARVLPQRVVCKGCRKWISLDQRSEYYPGLWEKHRDLCRAIKMLKGQPIPKRRRRTKCAATKKKAAKKSLTKATIAPITEAPVVLGVEQEGITETLVQIQVAASSQHDTEPNYPIHYGHGNGEARDRQDHIYGTSQIRVAASSQLGRQTHTTYYSHKNSEASVPSPRDPPQKDHTYSAACAKEGVSAMQAVPPLLPIHVRAGGELAVGGINIKGSASALGSSVVPIASIGPRPSVTAKPPILVEDLETPHGSRCSSPSTRIHEGPPHAAPHRFHPYPRRRSTWSPRIIAEQRSAVPLWEENVQPSGLHRDIGYNGELSLGGPGVSRQQRASHKRPNRKEMFCEPAEVVEMSNEEEEERDDRPFAPEMADMCPTIECNHRYRFSSRYELEEYSRLRKSTAGGVVETYPVDAASALDIDQEVMRGAECLSGTSWNVKAPPLALSQMGVENDLRPRQHQQHGYQVLAASADPTASTARSHPGLVEPSVRLSLSRRVTESLSVSNDIPPPTAQPCPPRDADNLTLLDALLFLPIVSLAVLAIFTPPSTARHKSLHTPAHPAVSLDNYLGGGNVFHYQSANTPQGRSARRTPA
ncbi:hypothetical protein H0H81_010436 [Sphagnurus paluster]|uniref:Uncharacterized protein n=1 Tax=Sphagnurus paluster TaxID=117069 RepID=A0A9P7FPA6_9AGAR|nr:hypothetical protein H0H81_010436 [Sphagnurus paluster]